jgi:hypothetical protein
MLPFRRHPACRMLETEEEFMMLAEKNPMIQEGEVGAILGK